MADLSALLEKYRGGVESVTTALDGIQPVEVDFVPGPGKWSVRQIMAHLADTELVAAFRFRLVIAEENPPISAFDQEAWARNLDYARRDPSQSLEKFRALRGENYELLTALPETAFDRTANHSKNGPITLRQMLETFGNHAESHARQVRQIRETYRSAQTR